MNSYFTLVLTLLFLTAAPWMVNADLFVVDPLQGSVCQANQPCQVTWLDDGRAPLLSAIGVTTVGLYFGNMQLIQSLSPVDVSTERSLTFTPIPEAGPDSDGYYIAFTSTTLQANGTAYIGFSAYFTLTDMSGSFDSPLPAATSLNPIPPSLTQSHSTSTSTVTVGTLYSTPSPPSTTTSTTANPRFTTIPTSSSSSSTLSSSPASSSSSSTGADESGAVGSRTNPTILASLVLSTLLSWFFLMLDF